MRARAQQAGFTLIELVITLVISTIVVSFVSLFITGPVRGFADQARRVRLVDAADATLQRMERDVRRALPNSVRTTTVGTTVTALELLSTVDGARYRAQPPGGNEQILEFSSDDDSFNVLGPFTRVDKPFISTSHYLAVYNIGVPGADAYASPANVMTPGGTTVTITADGVTGQDRVTMLPRFRFAYPSPTQRIFLVEGPVTYLCNTATGTLMRYDGYAVAPTQPTSPGALIGSGATESLMANQVAACSFRYAPGTAERAGLVTLEIAVSAQGESVSLLSQVHVDNVP